jgi:hypothetical protein
MTSADGRDACATVMGQVVVTDPGLDEPWQHRKVEGVLPRLDDSDLAVGRFEHNGVD